MFFFAKNVQTNIEIAAQDGLFFDENEPAKMKPPRGTVAGQGGPFCAKIVRISIKIAGKGGQK